MNEEFQLKLQAYLDGELSAQETREVEAWLASDNDAKALLSELKNTRAAFLMFEKELKLPESREFFWSKIEREIRTLEVKSAHQPAKVSWLAPLFLRRVLIPAGAFAAVVLAGFLTIQQTGLFSKKTLDLSEGIETAMVDSGAVTYRDHQEGMTVVWLPYPAENEFTETIPDDTL